MLRMCSECAADVCFPLACACASHAKGHPLTRINMPGCAHCAHCPIRPRAARDAKYKARISHVLGCRVTDPSNKARDCLAYALWMRAGGWPVVRHASDRGASSPYFGCRRARGGDIRRRAAPLSNPRPAQPAPPAIRPVPRRSEFEPLPPAGDRHALARASPGCSQLPCRRTARGHRVGVGFPESPKLYHF